MTFISRRLYPIPLLFVLFGLFILAGQATGSTQPGATPAEMVGTLSEQGACLWEMVGPGLTQGNQRLYLSFTYPQAFEIASVDVDTGQVLTYTHPTTSETMVWGMTVGPDGAIYLGTASQGHLMRLDPKSKIVQDLGQPASGETYIWSLTTGADGKIYGGTYPHARLFRYDPATGKSEDLGRMNPEEMYVRTVAASQDGFIYAGIGYSTAHLVAYEIASGTYRDILPPEYQRQGNSIMVGRYNGKVYAEWAAQWNPHAQWTGRKGQKFLLEGWNVTPVSDPGALLYEERFFMGDDKVVMLDQAPVVYYDNYIPLIPGD